MSTATFLCLSAVMLGGLVLLWLRYQKLGALALSIAMAAFLAILPWPTLNLLMKENRDIRGFAAPRLDAIRAVWTATSLAFSVTVGLFIALRKPTGKKRDWEAPTSAPGLDESLMRSLARAKEEKRTFIGITQDQREVSLDTIARERHMQIVGPTRSGKSQLLLALTAQDMHAGIPVFLMEAKGDRSDYDQFIKLAELAGRTDSVRYFNPNDIRSMTFNPIRRVPGQDSTAIANQIARAIGREPTSSGEGQDYYRSVDYAKIQNMAEIFCHVGLQFTLRDCFYYFSSQDAREAVFEMCTDRRLVGTAIDGFEKNEDSSALCSAFQPWTTGRLGELLNTYSPQIKLEDIFAGNQLAYFAIPVGQLQVLANPLGRMVIAGLLSLASSRQKAEPKPGPASIILDEFAEFATPVFASFIATVGSAKLWTILSHQDLGQLKKVQGMDADAFASAVFNNTSGCKICFRAPDPEDAEFWSSTLGTFSTSDDTERISRGFLGEQKTGEMSRRMVEQFKIHPNRIKNLAPGTALIFAPGQEDCLVKTARVHELLKNTRAPLFGVPTENGLDLASVVDDPGAAKKQDHRGKVKA